MKEYFQDKLYGNNCYGCGAWNENGLKIKSFWDKDESICIFKPQKHNAAMPIDVMNGGTIATVIDCHGVCSSIADAYRSENKEIGEGQKIWFATASLKIDYKKPTPMKGPITLRGKIIKKNDRKTIFDIDVYSYSKDLTCKGIVTSVRVSDKWSHPKGLFNRNYK